MNKILVKLSLWMAFLFLMTSAQVLAQKTIKGTVTDSADGSTLPGVSIYVKGTTVGTITDLDGKYTLIVPAGKDEIAFSMVGYATVTLMAGDQTVIDVVLKATVEAIDEVVVVGYGTQTRSKVTSSIAKVDMKLLETGMRSNPAQALTGTVPGLRLVTASGRPGAVPSLVLRGGTNFDGTGSPLIIMDGQIRGSLSDINPEEIESMEVLKDASATAIYGARASNGVILITSKKGKAGVSTVTVKVKNGTNFLNTPYDFVDAENYIKWARLGAEQAIKNGTLTASNVAGAGPRGTGSVYKDASGNIIDGNYDSRAIWSVMRLDANNQELLSQPGWKQMKDVIKTAANGN
ncbi:MAG: carboxypeptidase-like regulatory domain-containing protein, partial [Bacteroidota bacterium]|nr:carboxypeptidase-like regulatory domain-containing protein [Bacteroidota bacterium]